MTTVGGGLLSANLASQSLSRNRHACTFPICTSGVRTASPRRRLPRTHTLPDANCRRPIREELRNSHPWPIGTIMVPGTGGRSVPKEAAQIASHSADCGSSAASPNRAAALSSMASCRKGVSTAIAIVLPIEREGPMPNNRFPAMRRSPDACTNIAARSGFWLASRV
jgi:hypothetical protein